MSDAVGGVGSFKDRIGRVRFLLEFSIGVAVLQVSNSHPIAPTVVLGIGLLVALGRFAQRLRYGVKNKWGIGVSLASRSRGQFERMPRQGAKGAKC